MARISLESAGSGKSAPSGSSSKPSKSSGGGGGGALASMDKAQKIKLGVASALLVVGGLLTAMHLGLLDFSSGAAPVKDADVFQGGKPPSAEEAERNSQLQKKLDDQIEKDKKKFGSQGA